MVQMAQLIVRLRRWSPPAAGHDRGRVGARLLYRDGLMLVIDKPAGTRSIAARRRRKSRRSFHALRFGLPRDPALVHRLDRDTSGCLVLGRHHKALEKLGLLFKQGKIAKTYRAIVEGTQRKTKA